VLVWFHGGAFMFGAGSSPMSHGTVLARRGNVVVVTVNYRLGLFGYLRGIDVCGEALASTGNEGLQDQLAALRWIRDEIAAFGGDSENVTVFGQSAGGVSIAAMLTMSQARGLFHKAIVQSGSAMLVQTGAAANRVMASILGDVGLAPHEAGRLRDLPAARLLDLQERVTPRSEGVAYGHVADGTEIPLGPLGPIATGSAAGIPLLIGTNLEERKFQRRLDPEVDHLSDEGLLARLADARVNAQTGDTARFDPIEAVAVYRRERAARDESTAAQELWFAILSDRRYRVPAMLLAEAHALHTAQTHAYLFSWKSPAWDGKLGAGHVVEIPFVFGTLDAPDSRDLVPEGSPTGALPDQMQDAWITFARSGSPRTPDLQDWEPYTVPRRPTMLFGNTSGPVDAPRDTERRFWVEHGATSAPRQVPVV
jgi:para-nitrobenzyl esterase